MTLNKKKIGCVIAYAPDHNNYGTSLQGYATLKKIEQLGYDCEVIQYIKQPTLCQKVGFVASAAKAGYLKTIVNRVIAQRGIKKANYLLDSFKQRTTAVNEYKAKKLEPYFHKYIGYRELQTGSLNYDAVVVGSDQVWTPMSLYNKYFNLLFVDDSVKKVAYASSFGVSEIPKSQIKATATYLDRFAQIGVREERGKEIVDSLSKNKAKVVTDPTLLLTREEWTNEISDSRVDEREPYIFVYFLGHNPQSRAAVNELKQKTGYKVITIRHMDEYVEADETFGDEAPYYVDPNDFVKYISQAEYVCTDSFHCSVFSIIFHRQFMTFYRFAQGAKASRNSRIDSLFNVLGINKERIYTGEICKTINNSIDYNPVDERLENLRNDSIQFLSDALKN